MKIGSGASFGPPGTGKTTFLAQLVRECAAKYGEDRILITSFTRSAATEIAGRDLPLLPHQIGTLHAHCYRSLNHPKIAESKLKEWNEEHPDLSISGGRDTLDEPDTDVGGDGAGDKIFQEYQVLRARMTPEKEWPLLVRAFHAEWKAWKDENFYTDFTDLIERCLQDVEYAPDEPSILFGDECLHGDSLVLFDDGRQLPIREIVEKRIEGYVLSLNDRQGGIESKKVTGWHKNELRGRKFGRIGNLVATLDHPVYTREFGYVSLGICIATSNVTTVMKKDGELIHWSELKHESRLELGAPAKGEEFVYCLDVEDNHNFFADGILVHNCQDYSSLEISLLRKWASKAEVLYTAGDDDQSIFGWKGADGRSFLTPDLLLEHTKVLDYSWRLPRRIQEYATDWIKQVQWRKEKIFAPRRNERGTVVEGAIEHTPYSHNDGRAIANLAAKESENGSVMILTSCSYMLGPILKALREEGLPFANFYRLRRGDWNPLGTGRGTTASQRILMYLLPQRYVHMEHARYWTAAELAKWTEALESKGVLKRGAKTWLAAQSQEIVWEPEHLQQVFEPDAIPYILDGDLEWFEGHVLGSKRDVYKFPFRIIERSGVNALRQKPRITIGTVHCSPGDELILTVGGALVPIAGLDSNRHRLVSYDAKACSLRGIGHPGHKQKRSEKGYGFTLGENYYEGTMITVLTDKSRTRITPDHRVRVRFSKKFFDKWVVYLMRRDDWWRIGHCVSARSPYISGGIPGRLGTELAQHGWLLGIYESKAEAIIAESILIGRYGIPSITFESTKDRATRGIASKDLHVVHEATKGFVAPRARQLLLDFDLREDVPLYWRYGVGHRRVLQGYGFETIAANIASGYMEMPVVDDTGKAIEWLPLSTLKEPFSGNVYSLDVQPHQHYVSGNAVVHNSVKGGEGSTVILFPDLSLAGWNAMQESPDGRDATARLMYVGMTRAKEKLILGTPAGPTYVDLPSA